MQIQIFKNIWQKSIFSVEKHKLCPKYLKDEKDYKSTQQHLTSKWYLKTPEDFSEDKLTMRKNEKKLSTFLHFNYCT